MNYDEFAFFNQQLAAMLRDGIPLEGAVRRLGGEMRAGTLRSEMEALAADLAKGTPLREAVRARKFPDFYSQLLEVGAQSNDLPAVLTMLADYYQQRHATTTRLKGLMTYPVIILVCAFLLSCFLCGIVLSLAHGNIFNTFGWRQNLPTIFYGFWAPPITVGLLLAAALALLTVPALRRTWRWRLPAFKEASIAQSGAAMALMLKSGVPLPDALSMVKRLEAGTPASREISKWSEQLAAGRGKFSEMAAGSKIFPPLFVWLAGNAGEDLGAGFQRASEIYQARANYRTQMLLYSALPCAVLLLGLMLISEVVPLVSALVTFLNAIG